MAILRGALTNVFLVSGLTVAGMTYDDVQAQVDPVAKDEIVQMASDNASEFANGIKDVSLTLYQAGEKFTSDFLEAVSEDDNTPVAPNATQELRNNNANKFVWRY